MMPDLDLWGDPIPPRPERRGRRPHEATPEKRSRIKVLRALNHTEAQIAAAIGIPERTMRRYYRPELAGGRAQLRAEVLVRLWEVVQTGNVAAIKLFLAQIEKSDLDSPRAAAPARQPKLGKKEQALVDAATPDTTSHIGELMSRRAAFAKLH